LEELGAQGVGLKNNGQRVSYCVAQVRGSERNKSTVSIGIFAEHPYPFGESRLRVETGLPCPKTMDENMSEIAPVSELRPTR
jgi:hypothetical protein